MENFWNKSIDIIKEKVTKQNFETWLSPVRISSMNGPDIELSVPNRFFRDWLTDHYMGIIRESLSAVAGMPLSVRFIIDKAPARGKKSLNCRFPPSRPSSAARWNRPRNFTRR